MSEENSIKLLTGKPNTISSLIDDFKRLGVCEGMTLLVHSSMSSLGWVCGGPVAVINALETVLTSSGTLVMPTHSTDLSDPAHWCNPPVPEAWWKTIRNEMPLFDNAMTPTRGMGKVPETFRRQKGVMRSNHPCLSFSAEWSESIRSSLRA